MFLRAKKIVAVAAAIVFIAAWFTHGILDNTYVNYPRIPNKEEGRTVPYAVKGIVVYISEGQQVLLSWLTRIEIASGIVLAFVIILHRGDPFRSKD